jgi:hypothetical protein
MRVASDISHVSTVRIGLLAAALEVNPTGSTKTNIFMLVWTSKSKTTSFPTQIDPMDKCVTPMLYLRFRAVKQASFVTGHIPNAQDATLVIRDLCKTSIWNLCLFTR